MENTTESANDTDFQATRNQSSEHGLFEQLKSYPFSGDAEFAKGLSIILGHPETPASDAEVSREDDIVLQAKCFYFSRKEKLPSPVNFTAYKAWLKPDQSVNVTSQSTAWQPGCASSGMASVEGGTQQTSQEPTYPSSFAHIVELITTGQPIPGIQDIPDTVLTGHDTASTKPRRRKPWETEGDQAATHDN